MTDFENPITDYAFKYYFTSDGLCSLCGQSGIIHTEGIRSPAGVVTGRENFCICPNGQALREMESRTIVKKGHCACKVNFETVYRAGGEICTNCKCLRALPVVTDTPPTEGEETK